MITFLRHMLSNVMEQPNYFAVYSNELPIIYQVDCIPLLQEVHIEIQYMTSENLKRHRSL